MLRTIFAICCLLLTNDISFAAGVGIMAWGPGGPDAAKIGVNEVRVACYKDPKICLDNIATDKLVGIRKVSIAFVRPDNYGQAIGYASEYGRLAARYGIVKDVGIDDFYDFMSRLRGDEAAGYLDALISAAKGGAAALKFSVTVYEDQLSAIEKDGSRYPAEVRKKIDRVAFYLHYRKSFYKYNAILDSVKKLFPNAEVYAGVYNYDRIDYLSCNSENKIHCSEKEELDLFRETLFAQMRILRQGGIEGIEFYPGNFGGEGRWEGWGNDRICSRARKSVCIDNSMKMNLEVNKALR